MKRWEREVKNEIERLKVENAAMRRSLEGDGGCYEGTRQDWIDRAYHAEALVTQLQGDLNIAILQRDATLCSMCPRTAAGEEREADLHDIITELWAITDPDDASEGLQARVNQVLGANDPEGHCGNRVCAQRLEESQRGADRHKNNTTFSGTGENAKDS